MARKCKEQERAARLYMRYKAKERRRKFRDQKEEDERRNKQRLESLRKAKAVQNKKNV